jgi:hypothetical protein
VLLGLLAKLFRNLVVTASLLERSVPSLRCSLAPGKVLGKRPAEDVTRGVLVGIKGRESREQDEDQSAGKGKGQVVAEKPVTQVADGAGLIR